MRRVRGKARPKGGVLGIARGWCDPAPCPVWDLEAFSGCRAVESASKPRHMVRLSRRREYYIWISNRSVAQPTSQQTDQVALRKKVTHRRPERPLRLLPRAAAPCPLLPRDSNTADVQHRANRRCADISRSVQGPNGARLSVMSCGAFTSFFPSGVFVQRASGNLHVCATINALEKSNKRPSQLLRQ